MAWGPHHQARLRCCTIAHAALIFVCLPCPQANAQQLQYATVPSLRGLPRSETRQLCRIADLNLLVGDYFINPKN